MDAAEARPFSFLWRTRYVIGFQRCTDARLIALRNYWRRVITIYTQRLEELLIERAALESASIRKGVPIPPLTQPTSPTEGPPKLGATGVSFRSSVSFSSAALKRDTSRSSIAIAPAKEPQPSTSKIRPGTASMKDSGSGSSSPNGGTPKAPQKPNYPSTGKGIRVEVQEVAEFMAITSSYNLNDRMVSRVVRPSMGETAHVGVRMGQGMEDKRASRIAS